MPAAQSMLCPGPPQIPLGILSALALHAHPLPMADTDQLSELSLALMEMYTLTKDWGCPAAPFHYGDCLECKLNCFQVPSAGPAHTASLLAASTSVIHIPTPLLGSS